jgi:hypothetical protein
VRFAELAGRQLESDADRVYTLTGEEKIDVLFTHGAMGVFKERDAFYRAILACGINLEHDLLRIYFLGSPLQQPLVERRDEQQVTEEYPASEIIETVYRRVGSDFVFVASQPFSEDGPEIEKSDLLD